MSSNPVVCHLFYCFFGYTLVTKAIVRVSAKNYSTGPRRDVVGADEFSILNIWALGSC